MRIDLPLLVRGDIFDTESVVWRTVKNATLLPDIAPHLSLATLAVHRSPLWDGGFAAHRFNVSDIETGQTIAAASSDSPAGAIEDAKAILATKTDADIQKAHKRALRLMRDADNALFALIAKETP
jgi:hypothetical protein